MSMLYSIICAVICLHAIVDLNASTRRTSRLHRGIEVVIACSAFAGIFRPALQPEHATIVSTLLLGALAADCIIRHYRRHWYADRCDRGIIARRLRSMR